MDGTGCAILFLKMGGLRENIRFVGPESIHKVVTELCNTYSGHLLFVDVGVDEHEAELLNERGRGDVILIDHHRTSIPLSKYSWANISASKDNSAAGTACGTLMMWEHYLLQHSEIAEYEGMARMIDDYDRWIHKNPMSQKFADLHTLIGHDMFINRFLDDSRVKLTDIDEKILNIDKKKKEEYFERKMNEVTVQTTRGIKIGVVLGNRYTSECCNHLLNNHPDGLDVAIMVDAEGNRASLRSRKEGVDVSEIASLNGGGGHAAAAGFFLRGPHALKIQEKFLKKLKLPIKRKRISRKKEANNQD